MGAGRVRSVRYPRKNLSAIIEQVDILYRHYKHTPFRKEDLAQAIGMKSANSGTVTMFVASMKYFGLIEREGEKYRLTELAKKVLNPMTPAEKEASLKTAFLSPELFADVYKSLKAEESLPKALHVILVNDFGIARQSAKRAAEIFLESGQFAGVFGRDGQLLDTNTDESAEMIHEQTMVEEETDSAVFSGCKETGETASGWSFRFPLAQGNAVLYVPNGFTRKDLSKLKKYLEVLELDLAE